MVYTLFQLSWEILWLEAIFEIFVRASFEDLEDKWYSMLNFEINTKKTEFNLRNVGHPSVGQTISTSVFYIVSGDIVKFKNWDVISGVF